jgi:hypothetical protein
MPTSEDGPKVRTIRFKTTSEEEGKIMSNIEKQGGASPFLCATSVGSAVRGVGRFKGLGSTMTPGGLGRELDRILTPPTPSPFFPSEGGGAMRFQWSPWLSVVGSHLIASIIVIYWNWGQINRRLALVTLPIVATYAILSVVIIIFYLIFRRSAKFGELGITAALVPYISASIAYLTVYVASDRFLAPYGPNFLSVLYVGLIAPYFSLWGPLVSISNVFFLFLYRKLVR